MKEDFFKVDEPIVFNAENLLQKVHRLGPWSSFYLAEIAMFHYFPHIEVKEDAIEKINEMCRISGLFNMYWHNWVIKYHTEIGYKEFNPDYVNEH